MIFSAIFCFPASCSFRDLLGNLSRLVTNRIREMRQKLFFTTESQELKWAAVRHPAKYGVLVIYLFLHLLTSVLWVHSRVRFGVKPSIAAANILCWSFAVEAKQMSWETGQSFRVLPSDNKQLLWFNGWKEVYTRTLGMAGGGRGRLEIRRNKGSWRSACK